ncbi:hypothetical protein GCM10009429_10800 [Dyella marensis]
MGIRYGSNSYTIRKTRGRPTWEVIRNGRKVQHGLSELGAYAWARLDGEYCA